jgi:hypothetical protein
MFSASPLLAAISPRDGQKLARVLLPRQEGVNSSTPVLQLLLGEMASLKQQVNALALTQASPRQPVLKYERDDIPDEQKRVEPKRMTRIFD